MIRQLSEDTIKKIAAGEVIEGPFSVVKELVENSIDAGADEIRLSIKKGGKESILVSDNGSGISPEDFEKAFLPHATSKIRDFDDLYKIFSLGFRGEALASIIAVADLRARSKSEYSDLGLELYFKGGRLEDKKALAMNRGTSIEVYDIFSDIPVRRKFMKSDIAEANKISRIIYSLAIGHPGISISFDRDDRRIFHTPKGADLAECLLVLYGKTYHDSLLPIKSDNGLYKISGYIGNNNYYRANRQMQYLFVNGRHVEEDSIRDAIESVYKSVIPNGRFPAFQIFVETEANNLDINIHPNKKKIHFNELDSLLDLLENSVRQILFRNPSIASMGEEREENLFTDLSIEDSYKRILDSYSNNNKKKEGANYDMSAQVEIKDKPIRDLIKDKSSSALFGSDDAENEDIADFLEIFDKSSQVTDDAENEDVADLIEIFDETSQVTDREYEYENLSFYKAGLVKADRVNESPLPDIEGLNYIGSIFKVYNLFEDRANNLIYLMDQHAAHERINYEKFKAEVEKADLVSQALLQPIRLTLTDEERSAFIEKRDLLRKLAFDAELFTDRDVLIRSVPAILIDSRAEDIFYDLISFDLNDMLDYDKILDALAMRACKASVKQGDDLDKKEVIQLYKDLSKCRYPLTCPHGRPTIIKKSKYDLEKAFMRIK